MLAAICVSVTVAATLAVTAVAVVVDTLTTPPEYRPRHAAGGES